MSASVRLTKSVAVLDYWSTQFQCSASLNNFFSRQYAICNMLARVVFCVYVWAVGMLTGMLLSSEPRGG